jgi:predicted proteasome-type protease
MTFDDPGDRLMVLSASRSLAVQLALAALLACLAVL